MRRLVVLVPVLVPVLVVLLLVGGPPGAASTPRHRPEPCSRGLVALTFDDGPSAGVTPRMVRTLRRLEAPATFFMVGSRVEAAPDTALLVHRRGFAVGNHTWEHTDLTTQSADEIRHALRRTRKALVAAGVTPTALVRPPYGAIDDRVRRVLAAAGYTPALWTIDPRDWAGGTPHRIARRVIEAVRPHRTNIVLQHDGVTHSSATVKAIREEVETLRRRGYCFAGLGSDGRPTPPRPLATVATDTRRVTEGGTVRVTVRLDEPTSRRTSARVTTQDVATSAADYGWSARTAHFGVGDTVAHLRMPFRRDGLDEGREEVMLRIMSGSGIEPAYIPQAMVEIIDVDDPPGVGVSAAPVTTAPLLDTVAPVVVRLDHRSGRDVHVLLRVPGGQRWVRVPAGSMTATLPVTLPPGRAGSPVRRLPVAVVRAVHATASGEPATLVVRPPRQTRAEALRKLAASIPWRVAVLPGLF